MSDGFDIPINTDDAAKALESLLKKLDTFGNKADKVLEGFEKSSTNAFDGASKASGSLEKSVGSISTTLKGFGILAVGALGVGAINKLTDSMGDAIEAASNKEAALKGVENALRRTGEFSAEALSEVSAFADKLEDTTGLADDTALKMFTLADSFTKNKDQAIKLVTAANDLSAATGKSLEASVTALGKSLTGTLGPLDEFDPSLKKLSKSALEAGAAIDAVMKNFGGAAAAQMQTFQGATTTVVNKLDDIQVAFGELITKNPVVIDLIKTFGDVMGNLAGLVSKNQDGIRSFIKDGILFALEGMSSLIPVVQLVVDGFGAIVKASTVTIEGILGIAKAITSFKPAADFIKFLIDQLSKLAEVALTVYQGFLKLPESLLGAAGIDISGLGEALEGVKLTIQETNTEIQNADLSTTFDNAAISVDAFKTSSAGTFDALSQGIGNAKTGVDAYIQRLSQIPSSVAGPAIGGPSGGGGAGGRAAAAAPFGNGRPDTSETDRTLAAALERRLPDALATAGQGFAQGLQAGGQAGAAKAVGGAASGIAQLAGAAGPMAGAIGSAIELLGQDPESFKTMIQGFVDGIPIIIDNIVENIPVLVETLANNLGPIITSLLNAIPRITIAVIKAIPVVIRSILSQLSGGISFQADKIKNAGSGFATNIVKAHQNFNAKILESANRVRTIFSNLITNQINFQKKLAEKQLEFARKIGEFIKSQINKNIEFGRKIVDAGRNFALKIFEVFKRIKSTFDNLIENIKGIFGGGGGGGGSTGLGFAKGGIVPKTLYAASGAFVPRGTDTVPAMLTPGELVVPRDLVGGIRDMVDGNAGFDAQTALALLARAVDLLSQPINVTTEAKINGKALADVILQLNRQGARLTA